MPAFVVAEAAPICRFSMMVMREHATAFRHHDQALLTKSPRALALMLCPGIRCRRAFIGQRAGDGLHGGGLAGAVGADQRHQLALAHLKVHALHGLDAAIGHLQAGDLQQVPGCLVFRPFSMSPVPR